MILKRIVFIVRNLKMLDNKKTWTNNFVMLSWYRQIPCSHKQVKAHAYGVSINLYS